MSSPLPIITIDYLDTLRSLPEVQDCKQISYELLAVEPGQRILELGCATGEDVQALAAQVGQTGQVIGLDSSEDMLTEAIARASNHPLPIEFHQGSAEALDFEDNCFDSCRAERLLHLLEHPLQALNEMARVVRPGGKVVILEPDWATLVVYPSGPYLRRSIFEVDQSGTVGRQLPSLFKRSGLQVSKIVPMTCVLTDFVLANQVFLLKSQILEASEAGAIPQTQAIEWLIELAEATEKGEFFSAMTGFIVCGYKPL